MLSEASTKEQLAQEIACKRNLRFLQSRGKLSH